MSEAPVLPRLISAPARPLPRGACDCHAHVFGPFDRFPLATERTRTPPEASPAEHRAMQDTLGFERSVIVQGSAHGTDNRAVADAVRQAGDRARGIGVIDETVTDEALHQLQQAGFAGMRFTEFALPGGMRKPVSGFDALVAVAPRLMEHRLHAQLFTEIDVLIPAIDRFLALDMPLVIDHMGKAFATPVDLTSPNVQRFLALVREGRLWVKMTVIRGSDDFPQYRPLRAFHDALVEANPARLLWGTDWPLLSLGSKTPDPGRLIDLFDDWTHHDQTLRQAVFVSNPAAFYGFPSIEEQRL